MHGSVGNMSRSTSTPMALSKTLARELIAFFEQNQGQGRQHWEGYSGGMGVH
jgi:hypothetical protein